MRSSGSNSQDTAPSLYGRFFWAGFVFGQQYSFEDLGTIEGSESSYAIAVSDAGTVAGGTDPSGSGGAVWRRGVGWTSLPTLSDGRYVAAQGIAGSDTVVGTNYGSTNTAIYWNPQEGSVSMGGWLNNTNSGALGATDNGWVAGRAETVDHQNHAFRWSKQTGMEDLGDGYGVAANQAGNVVGTKIDKNIGGTSGFLWVNGNRNDFGRPPGYRDTYSVGVSANNEVFGYSFTQNLQNRDAWVRNIDGSFDFFGRPWGNGVYRTATANEAGMAVGQARTRSNRAWFWTRQSGMVDLGSVLDSTGTGWHSLS